MKRFSFRPFGRLLFFLLFSLQMLTLVSCSKTADEDFEDALFDAKEFLNSGNCAQAIASLEAVGTSASRDIEFLQLYASAYACRSGYADLAFFEDVTSNLNANTTDFLNSISTFATSITETSVETQSFTDILTAIEILTLGGGNSAGTHSGRSSIFTAKQTQALNIQALFMTVAAIGKYVHYHGDTNTSTGIKAQCIFNYSSGAAQGAGFSGGGGCSGAASPDSMSGFTTANIRRLCQGTVLYNYLVDLLLNTTLGASGDLGDVDEIYDNVSAGYDLMCDNAPLACASFDVSTCETTFASSDQNQLELFIAAVYDGTMQ